ncbi:hypothetical protein [Streptomyces atratus]|uniref:hypothetical protein n=1 Tax=Streptomyces atratus TaxID=1893 RepID=UPI00166FD884|nr:hypothetical protein [Streptomyces atratus]WPW31623.1 hypothetical protein P6B95_32345 [Streptomyces atratus]GGT40075.1 hypothetical protein GCM10010207_45280 [Streptomyces atratus]
MLKLDAPGNSFQSVISNHDYPDAEAEWNGTGPGWSWMWVPYPFNSQRVQGQFTRHVFKRNQTSRDDLRAFIGENLAENDRRWSKAAAAALRGVTAQEFVLICSNVWAFALFEVNSGSTAKSGTAFYNRWVGRVNADPEAPYMLMAAEKPVVMAMG